MKLATIALATTIALSGTLACAQSRNSAGRGSTTGDPAANSANTGTNATTTGTNPSGIGTSTSGGRDANNDQGRDKMPDSSQGVRPYDTQNKPTK